MIKGNVQNTFCPWARTRLGGHYAGGLVFWPLHKIREPPVLTWKILRPPEPQVEVRSTERAHGRPLSEEAPHQRLERVLSTVTEKAGLGSGEVVGAEGIH